MPQENLQNALVSNLYKYEMFPLCKYTLLMIFRENLLSELMRETDDIAQSRKRCRETKELLQKAVDIVNEVRVCGQYLILDTYSVRFVTSMCIRSKGAQFLSV